MGTCGEDNEASRGKLGRLSWQAAFVLVAGWWFGGLLPSVTMPKRSPPRRGLRGILASAGHPAVLVFPILRCFPRLWAALTSNSRECSRTDHKPPCAGRSRYRRAAVRRRAVVLRAAGFRAAVLRAVLLRAVVLRAVVLRAVAFLLAGMLSHLLFMSSHWCCRNSNIGSTCHCVP